MLWSSGLKGLTSVIRFMASLISYTPSSFEVGSTLKGHSWLPAPVEVKSFLLELTYIQMKRKQKKKQQKKKKKQHLDRVVISGSV